MQEFRLPDPGEGLVEAEIVTWRVAVGDAVQINDILVEIETSKSLVELPSPYAGRVAELLVAEGQTVDVGTPIIAIDDGADVEPERSAPAATESASAEPTAPEQPSEAPSAGTTEEGAGGHADRVAVLVGYGPRTTEARRRPRRTAVPASGSAAQAQQQVADVFSTAAPVSRHADVRHPLRPYTDEPHSDEPVGRSLPSPGSGPIGPVVAAGPVLAKPPVRKLAKDLGVDLASLTGSGDGGVITRQDVESAANGGAERAVSLIRQAQDTASKGGEDTRIPIKGVRKLTAEAMVRSAFTAPHVTEWLAVDLTGGMEFLERLRQRREFAEVKVTPMLLVARAVCLALARTRELNASWDEAAQEIVLHSRVNLGVAAATPRGLLVPNIKGAHTLSLLDLATALGELVATARDGKTQPADLNGGTFTITNVGVFGVDGGTPILNPPEAGILCVGAIARRPWVVGSGAEERVEPRWVTTLALSFDHRIVDGEQGSRFLADVADLVSDPSLALLYA